LGLDIALACNFADGKGDTKETLHAVIAVTATNARDIDNSTAEHQLQIDNSPASSCILHLSTCLLGV